jgi:hypothetical protein
MKRMLTMACVLVAGFTFAGCYGSGSTVSVGVGVGGYGYPYYGGYGGYGGWGGWGGVPYGGVVITGRPYVPRTHQPIDDVEAVQDDDAAS